MAKINREYVFPKNFLWGTATSAYQTEGNNQHSDWWEWEKEKNIERSGITCDNYNLYEKDFKLAKEVLHNNAIRISIEWSRIQPKKSVFSKKEINHYKKVLSTLKKLDLKVVLTLHHFTNPTWFTKGGGWENKNNLIYFEGFVDICVREFGNAVDYWIIFNEPNVYTAYSYLRGYWPPQQKNLYKTFCVYRNIANAHIKAYKIIHKYIPGIHVASCIQMINFRSDNPLGKLLAYIFEYITNYFFITLTKSTWDFVGINYYFQRNVALNNKLLSILHPSDFFSGGNNPGSLNAISPEGLYIVSKNTFRKYKLPILITESGINDPLDQKRPEFILNHLKWLRKAISEKVDVKGYFHWTLMDNFEWDSGRKIKFGLFQTDYKTFKRVPRRSAFVYGKICKENKITF